MDIYGYFYIGYHAIHYVTLICILILGLFYLYRLKDLSSTILMKPLISGLYVVSAVVYYEILWAFGSIFYYPNLVNFLGFIMCELVCLAMIKMLGARWGYWLPGVDFIRLGIVSGVMLVLIQQLCVSGFYVVYLGGSVDPHNFIWALGKAVGLLSWMWIPKYVNQ